MPIRRILLIGGGRSHLEVLRRAALAPDPGVELTLVTPNALALHKAMAPGFVAGHYGMADSHIELPALARWARARLVCDRAVELDLYTRIVRLAEGGVEPFDLASLDIGSESDLSAPGAREHALPLCPLDRFLAAWPMLEADVARGDVRTVAVVGGSAEGIEMLLAMQHRLAQTQGADVPRFALVAETPHILPDHVASVRRRIGRILIARDVVLHTGSVIAAVDAGAIITASGRRIAADRVVWATATSVAPWLGAASLDCDGRGRVRVNASLQSVSDPFVFAAGSCAIQEGAPSPAVLARNTGASLATNLRHAARHEPVVPCTPRRSLLSIITTGPRHAIASWGPIGIHGERVWQWKDRLDRRYVARFRPPVPHASRPATAQ